MSPPPLIRVLRALPDSESDLVSALATADADELVLTAVRHGVGGALVDRLSTLPLGFPPGPLDALRRQVMASAAVTLKVKRLLVRTMTAFREHGVRAVLLKGYGLGARLYRTPFLRPTSDVDVLVAPRDMDGARTALRGLGLSPKVDSDDYYPPAYRHHEAFAGAGGLVELHHRLMSNWGATWEADEVLSRAVPAELDGLKVHYLAPEDELVYLALHAVNHMLSRLGWVYDLKLYVRAYPNLDWDRVIDLARRTQMPSPTFFAFDAAEGHLRAGFPQWVLRRLAPTRVTVSASRWVFSAEHLVDGYLDRHKLAWAATKVLLADDPRAVARFAVRRLAWNAQRGLSH